MSDDLSIEGGVWAIRRLSTGKVRVWVENKPLSQRSLKDLHDALEDFMDSFAEQAAHRLATRQANHTCDENCGRWLRA